MATTIIDNKIHVVFEEDRFPYSRVDFVKPNPKLEAIIQACSSKQNVYPHHTSVILALDPGETSGLAIWDPEDKNIRLEQLDTKDLVHSFKALMGLFAMWRPYHIRFEDYRVYGHKADDHINSTLHTSQLIAMIKLAAALNNIPCSSVMASAAKGFWTDEKLKMVGAYSKGLPHARDAERHLLYWMAFNSLKESQ